MNCHPRKLRSLRLAFVALLDHYDAACGIDSPAWRWSCAVGVTARPDLSLSPQALRWNPLSSTFSSQVLPCFWLRVVGALNMINAGQTDLVPTCSRKHPDKGPLNKVQRPTNGLEQQCLHHGPKQSAVASAASVTIRFRQ